MNSTLRNVVLNNTKIYPLEKVKGSVLVLSLDKLKKSAQKAIRVRRSNDNAEMDIGFVNDKLDVPTLLSFVGVNSGFVSIRYDQSGYGNHAVQAVLAYQPRIVNSGAIDVDDAGIYSLHFDGVDDRFDIIDNYGLNITTGDFSLMAAFDIDDSLTIGYIISRNLNDSNTVQYGLLYNTDYQAYLNGSQKANDAVTDKTKKIIVFTYNQSKINFYTNGTFIESNSYSTSLTSRSNMQIGCRSNAIDGSTKAVFFKGKMSNVIIFNKTLTQKDISYLTEKARR